jgi:hypothetical protein
MNQTATQPPIELHLPLPQPTKGEREHEAFLRLMPELLITHRGKFVAIHEGQMVDSDVNDISLIQRVHARYGYVPIHVGLVTEALPVSRVPHYRAYRTAEQGA